MSLLDCDRIWDFFLICFFLVEFRPSATIEGLAKLRPVFKKDGVVTAGNASVGIISDFIIKQLNQFVVIN